MEGQKDLICGTWKLRGEAAKIVIEQQNEFKERCPTHRGKYSKEKTINRLLCELYHLRNANKDNPEKAA